MAWVKLGTFPDMTVENARKAALGVLGDFAKGLNPAAAKREQRQKETLGDAFERYMQMHVEARDVKTGAEIRAIFERCLGTMPEAETRKHGRPRSKHAAGVDWSRRKLDAIDASDVQAVHAGIGRTHPILANRAIEILSAVYGRAARWGYRGANPCQSVEPFKETKRDRFIQADELPKFFSALAADTSKDFRDFVLLALLTGARRGNVLAMRWQELDLQAATWRIPQTKNDEPLTLPLMPEAIELLRGRNPQADGYVFPAESATGHITPPKKKWRALLKRAGVADLRIHDLRRSLGSWQAMAGASLSIIGKSLGHKSADATMIYARLSLDPVRQSVATATSAMLEAAVVKKRAKVAKMQRRART
jgi:integrase